MIEVNLKNRIYPENLDSQLDLYLVQDHDKIKHAYNLHYDQQAKQIIKDVELNYEKNKFAHDSHSQLIERILNPFYIHNKEFNCDFLFVDPLYFDNKQGIIQKICNFDLLFANLEKGEINTIILVEVKGRFPNIQISLEDLSEYEKNKKVRTLIFTKIQKYLKENYKTSVKISKSVRFEYVVAIQGYFETEAKKMIENKKLPLILWSIKNDIVDPNRYKIELKNPINPDNSLGIRTYHSSNDLKKLFQKEYQYNSIVKFIPSSGTHFIIQYIYPIYIKIFGKEITKDNLRELIEKDGLGKNYDDSSFIEILIENILKKGIDLGIMREESGKIYWKQVNIKNKILKNHIERQITKKSNQFLDFAIKNSKARRKNQDLKKWLK